MIPDSVFSNFFNPCGLIVYHVKTLDEGKQRILKFQERNPDLHISSYRYSTNHELELIRVDVAIQEIISVDHRAIEESLPERIKLLKEMLHLS